jgi:hypothetical protein
MTAEQPRKQRLRAERKYQMANERIEVTEEMVTAYLTANDAYWKRADELPARNPARWRQGTPSEATRVGLRAALDAMNFVHDKRCPAALNMSDPCKCGETSLTEVDLIEKAAVRVGMTSLLNHGAASCVYSEGCEGVAQEHLIAFAREIALHTVAALSYSKVADSDSKKPNGLATEAANPLISNENLAEWTGLEPATPGVTGPCANPATTGEKP